MLVLSTEGLGLFSGRYAHPDGPSRQYPRSGRVKQYWCFLKKKKIIRCLLNSYDFLNSLQTKHYIIKFLTIYLITFDILNYKIL